MMQKLKEMKQRWDHSIKAVLRRVSIFRRLNLSFMLLIMTFTNIPPRSEPTSTGTAPY